MMRLMSDLRRSVALIICPELRDETAHDAARQREVIRLWLADDRPAAARARLPLTQVEDQQTEACVNGKEPLIPAAQMEELLVRRRHSRIERCKEILQVIHLVEQGRVFQESDLLLDAHAERLAVLIFGEKSDDHH